MIPAAEALRLPSARLTQEEVEAADALESAIDAHVRQKMERRGCEFATPETRANVIAEINQRLKNAGWQPQIQALAEKSRIDGVPARHVGYQILLAPSDEAHRAAISRGDA